MSTHLVMNARGGRPAVRLRRLPGEIALAGPFRAGVRGPESAGARCGAARWRRI
jgi:hypothetical protein